MGVGPGLLGWLSGDCALLGRLSDVESLVGLAVLVAHGFTSLTSHGTMINDICEHGTYWLITG